VTEAGKRAFGVETVEIDLPALVSALNRRLHERGLPVTPSRSADFARALTLVRPVSRRRLYWTARSVFVSDPAQVKAFDEVFFSIFGSRVDERAAADARPSATPPVPQLQPRWKRQSSGSARPRTVEGDEDAPEVEVRSRSRATSSGEAL
jgi:uncharacterized protein with von Willebrand factor type A (vWA) domain